MDSDRTTYTLGELTSKTGSVSIRAKAVNLEVIVPRKRAQVEIKFVSTNGRFVAKPDYLPLPDEMVDVIAVRAAELKMKKLTVKVYLTNAAADRHQTKNKVTLGNATPAKALARVFWKNIYWQYPSDKQARTFLSVLAHEVGHVLHYHEVGAVVFYDKLSKLECEYAAEDYVAKILGPEYVRPIQEKFYKG